MKIHSLSSQDGKPSVARLKPNSISRQGFTLIELLVVIAIIAVLASVGFMGSRTLRAKSQAAMSASNMKQIYVGHQLYLAEYGFFPSANDWTSVVQAEALAGCKTWHERLAPFVGLGETLEESQLTFKKGELPPGVFLVPGRKRLVSENGGKGGGFRSGYVRNSYIFTNTQSVVAKSSAKTLMPVESLTQTYFLNDMGGDSAQNDLTWQIGKEQRLNWPAFGGEAGKLNGVVNVCFMDGHIETRAKSDIPFDYRDIFWNVKVVGAE